MATSETALFNRALARIGSPRITSADATSDSAQVIRDIWPDIRRSAIREHAWNFAVRRKQLAPLSTSDSYARWAYRFLRPGSTAENGGWLRTLGVYEDALETTPADYEPLSQYLYADVDTLFLVYIADITNVQHWDATFREAVTLKLASELAVTLTNSNRLHEGLGELATRAFAKARSIDAMEGRPPPNEMGTWESARFGWGA